MTFSKNADNPDYNQLRLTDNPAVVRKLSKAPIASLLTSLELAAILVEDFNEHSLSIASAKAAEVLLYPNASAMSAKEIGMCLRNADVETVYKLFSFKRAKDIPREYLLHALTDAYKRQNIYKEFLILTHHGISDPSFDERRRELSSKIGPRIEEYIHASPSDKQKMEADAQQNAAPSAMNAAHLTSLSTQADAKSEKIKLMPMDWISEDFEGAFADTHQTAEDLVEALVGALAYADPEGIVWILSQDNAKDIPAKYLGVTLRRVATEGMGLLFSLPNAKDITAEHLGEALAYADAEGIACILSHPNAKDIQAKYLGAALKRADTERMLLIFSLPHAKDITPEHLGEALAYADAEGIAWILSQDNAKDIPAKYLKSALGRTDAEGTARIFSLSHSQRINTKDTAGAQWAEVEHLEEALGYADADAILRICSFPNAKDISAEGLGKALERADAKGIKLICSLPNAKDIAAQYLKAALYNAYPEEITWVLSHLNLEALTVEDLGIALRFSNSKGKKLISSSPLAKDISAEYLGEGLRPADTEGIIWILSHPNAKDISVEHLASALLCIEDAVGAKWILSHPNAQNISAKDLGVALRMYKDSYPCHDVGILKLIFSHPNAKDISVADLSGAFINTKRDGVQARILLSHPKASQMTIRFSKLDGGNTLASEIIRAAVISNDRQLLDRAIPQIKMEHYRDGLIYSAIEGINHRNVEWLSTFLDLNPELNNALPQENLEGLWNYMMHHHDTFSLSSMPSSVRMGVLRYAEQKNNLPLFKAMVDSETKEHDRYGKHGGQIEIHAFSEELARRYVESLLISRDNDEGFIVDEMARALMQLPYYDRKTNPLEGFRRKDVALEDPHSLILEATLVTEVKQRNSPSRDQLTKIMQGIERTQIDRQSNQNRSAGL